MKHIQAKSQSIYCTDWVDKMNFKFYWLLPNIANKINPTPNSWITHLLERSKCRNVQTYKLDFKLPMSYGNFLALKSYSFVPFFFFNNSIRSYRFWVQSTIYIFEFIPILWRFVFFHLFGHVSLFSWCRARRLWHWSVTSLLIDAFTPHSHACIFINSWPPWWRWRDAFGIGIDSAIGTASQSTEQRAVNSNR
jgi:hypothetical protein